MRPLIAASVFLLLLIVLASPAWGQVIVMDVNPGMSMPDSTRDRPIILDKGWTFTDPTFLTLESWKEYKAECYADSTQHETGTIFHNCLVYGCKQVWADPRMVWVHRTPTFDGWMDWLERKLNRKEPTQ